MAVANKAELFQRATFQLLDCQVCHRPFAPQKEVAYTLALLHQAGMSDTECEARRPQLETCPECKRKQAMQHKGNVRLSPYFISASTPTTIKGGQS